MWDLDKGLQPVLPFEDYFQQGLYTFDVGQNDLDGAFYSKSQDRVVASIPAILTEFETGIKVIRYLFSLFRSENYCNILKTFFFCRNYTIRGLGIFGFITRVH